MKISPLARKLMDKDKKQNVRKYNRAPNEESKEKYNRRQKKIIECVSNLEEPTFREIFMYCRGCYGTNSEHAKCSLFEDLHNMVSDGKLCKRIHRRMKKGQRIKYSLK